MSSINWVVFGLLHAGEFLRLLRELAPDEEQFYAEGAEDVEREIEKMT
jgi:hypothetical protein